MNNILARITERIRAKQSAAWREHEIDPLPPIERSRPQSLGERLARNFGIIAEIKRASPSAGAIRLRLNPAALARIYERAGATAISVLTETHFFRGRPEDLIRVRNASALPLLRKDFLLHPRQVVESFNLGADVVLLIAACLTEKELRELSTLAAALGLEVLFEVHDQEEIERVLPLRPALMGINNRDLKTLAIDLGNSLRLRPLIPARIPVISESGIQTREQVLELKRNGFAGVLIGESLLRAPDAAATMRELLHDAD
jgi:indole-3-glycerol phosphate synthase